MNPYKDFIRDMVVVSVSVIAGVIIGMSAHRFMPKMVRPTTSLECGEYVVEITYVPFVPKLQAPSCIATVTYKERTDRHRRTQ